MAGMVEIKKEKYEMDEVEGDYPYGTRLMLEGDIVEQLGLSGIETGKTVTIKASAVISRKTEEAEEGEGVEKEVCLQIVKLGVMGEESVDRAKQMYGDNEGE